ncbi:MAG: type ISP restriction/modification enzyme [Chthoniobacterales bacterium]
MLADWHRNCHTLGTVPRVVTTIPRKALERYQSSINEFKQRDANHETAVRSAFQVLLDDCARPHGWKLVPEYPIVRQGRRPLRVDGALLDEFNLWHGLWEAKDSADDLERSVKEKFALGYPRRNILFQSPDRAILYQDGKRALDSGLATPEQIANVLRAFLSYEEPAWEEWERASTEFKDRIAEHGNALAGLLTVELKKNQEFRYAFKAFVEVCRTSINPTLSEAAVEEMLVQHLLTWRIFKGVFGIGDFMQKNVIAQEIEKLVLTIRAFSREDFLKTLNPFYNALEEAAKTITEFSEKQKFLNTVYERFFQGFAVRQADTLGIVYTPQPIVDFMVDSVDHLLRTEFAKESGLGSREVHMLDGFTGTGNFIVNLMRTIPPSMLEHKYAHELHCNEVMLLPYYVASMNIEHEYFETIGEYREFEGICFVDTFRLAEEYVGEAIQGELEPISEENSARIRKQRKQEIFVCIGNPPYNAGQLNENDNNKNLKYPKLDRRVSSTYGEASRATLLRKLSDPYVKAIRWATDRIGEVGIVAFVNNDSFVDEISFDGMRHHLARDFDLIYVLDLGGNVRKNPKLSGTTHNVFGIQVGVSINFFIRLPGKVKGARRQAKISYHAVPVDWRKEQKWEFLERVKTIETVSWQQLRPDAKNTWLTSDTDAEFVSFLPIGSKEAKAGLGGNLPGIFRTYSLGVSTNRDHVVYDFDPVRLAERAENFCDQYNAELERWQRRGFPTDLDAFLGTEQVKWSESLKQKLASGVEAHFDASAMRIALFRPYVSRCLYFDPVLVDRPGAFGEYLPSCGPTTENALICLNKSPERPFCCIATNRIPSKDVSGGFGSPTQCFPFYTYNEDGSNRRENIPLSTLVRFQSQYGDERITKWDIFYYVYALLHHPGYRTRFASNLKRELPRVPFAADFRGFADAGKRLLDLHVRYEEAEEFPLKRIEHRGVPFTLRVEEMKLTNDKQELNYNESLTLTGIPSKALEYRLGNRSALDWIINQYRVDLSTGSDPNQRDDEGYILRLIGQVITVSLETMKIVRTLPADYGAEGEQAEHDHELETWRLNQRLPSSSSAQQQTRRLKSEADAHSQTALSVNESSSSYGPAKRSRGRGRRIRKSAGPGHAGRAPRFLRRGRCSRAR